MSTIKVVSMTGAEVGTVELNDAIFGTGESGRLVKLKVHIGNSLKFQSIPNVISNLKCTSCIVNVI